MPWKECHVMDERLRFVARLLEGEKMTALCAEFGISRKTGYKIYDRYKDCGVVGLSDRSRRPQRQANHLPPAGARPRFVRSSASNCRTCRTARLSARSMRCWIATAWCRPTSTRAHRGCLARLLHALRPRVLTGEKRPFCPMWRRRAET